MTFPRLVQALAAGEDVGGIRGLVARRDGGSHFVSLAPERVQDLDTLPYPSYRDYFEQLRAVPGTGARSGSVLVESSRGCWWGGAPPLHVLRPERDVDGVPVEVGRPGAGRDRGPVPPLRRHPGREVDNILDLQCFRDLLPELARRRLDLGLSYETKHAGAEALDPRLDRAHARLPRIMARARARHRTCSS